MLTGELMEFCGRFQAIKADALGLLANLTEDEFNWEPGSNPWSIAQCIDHLVVTGNSSVSNIRRAINEARFRGSLGQELAFNAAHERRHLWQARLVRETPGFPGKKPAV